MLILNAKKAELRACQAHASTNLPSHGQRRSDGSDGKDDDDDDGEEEEGDDRSDNEGAAAASATSFYGAPPPPPSSSSSSLSQSTRSPGKRPLKKAKASSKADSESNIAEVETSGDVYRGTDFQQGPAEGTQEVKAGDLDRLLTQDLQDQPHHQQPPPLSPPPELPPFLAAPVSSSSSSASQLPASSSSFAAAACPRPPPPKRHM